LEDRHQAVRKKQNHFFYLALGLLLTQTTLAEGWAEGFDLFMNNCSECHQRSGRGIKGIYPSLIKSEIVTGNGLDIAQVLIIGRGEMPSFADAMTAKEMAQIINYIRHAWGNEKNLKTNVNVSADNILQLLQK
tara:strand:- start:30 stop:428 length:399 start_codon:yes stop_codon:yes gene_type:complete